MGFHILGGQISWKWVDMMIIFHHNHHHRFKSLWKKLLYGQQSRLALFCLPSICIWFQFLSIILCCCCWILMVPFLFQFLLHYRHFECCLYTRFTFTIILKLICILSFEVHACSGGQIPMHQIYSNFNSCLKNKKASRTKAVKGYEMYSCQKKK